MGFVFQEYNVLEDYSVGKNIGLALELQRKKADRAAIDNILASVDLKGFFERKPNELSGGQKQRVSIARALVKNPDIILADEPTGALDSNTGKQLFDVLKKLAQQKLIIVVSHDRENAELYGDRIIELADGDIISDRTRADSGQLKDTPPVNFLSDTLIQIQPGYQLDTDDLSKINSILAKSTNTAYISLDAKSNLAFDDKATKMGGAAAFEGTSASNLRIKTYDPKDFKLVRSRLPFGDSLKMGASGLKLKPVRLFFILLLSFVSFTMFGFTLTAMTVNSNKVQINNLVDNGVRNITISSVGGRDGGILNGGSLSESSGRAITEANISELEKITGKKHLKIVTKPSNSTQYDDRILSLTSNWSLGISDSYFQPLSDGIRNFIEVDDAESANLKNIAGRLPTAYDEIALSDWALEFFLKYGVVDQNDGQQFTPVKDAQDLIDQNVKLKSDYGGELKLVGIYSTDIDMARFSKYKGQEASIISTLLMDALKDTTVGMGYVKQGFGQNVKWSDSNSHEGNVHTFGRTNVYYKLTDWNDQEEYLQRIDSIARNDVVQSDVGSVIPRSIVQNNTVRLQPNEVLLGSRFVPDIDNKTFEEVEQMFAENTQKHKLKMTLTIDNRQDQTQTKEVVVKGIFYGDPNGFLQRTVVFDYDLFSELVWFDTPSTQPSSLKRIMLPTDGSKKMLNKVYDYLESTSQADASGEYVYKLTALTELSPIVGFIGEIIDILSKVFTVLGIIFAVFAALMLMNFIGVSVFHKKKQIGILRAIGARSRDVFKIFLNEGLIIGLMVFILSSIATIIISTIINNKITINIMTPGFITFGGLLGLAIVIVIVSTWLPVHKIANKKPIDAINNR